MEAHPLQIKFRTVSDAPEDSFSNVVFYPSESTIVTKGAETDKIGYIRIYHNLGKYFIKHCTNHQDMTKLASLSKPLPEDPVIWTIAKTSNRMILECNGEIFLNRDLDEVDPEYPDCGKKWKGDVAKIFFWKRSDS